MKNMKKFFFLAVSAMVMAGCGEKQATVPASEMQRQRDSLQSIIDSKDSELNDFMGTFAEIQQGLQQIAAAEGRVIVANGDIEKGANKAIIKDNMDFLRQTLAQQREKLSQLQKQLSNSSLNVKKMKEAIANLQTQLDAQTARVQELEAAIIERDETIYQQSTTIAQQDETINQQSAVIEEKTATVASMDKSLNEAWYVFGTKNELKAQKIIEDGEVLRSDNFNRNYFTKIDIRQTREIKLYSKSATLLTAHPSGTYQLVKDAKGEFALKITDVEKFWSTSKYLVIKVR